MKFKRMENKYDVVIYGGGLAGLTLALQLKKENSGISILILEKRAGNAPESAHKVGESTVELGTHYIRETLDLKEYLDKHQLPKHGLRFFFSPFVRLVLPLVLWVAPLAGALPQGTRHFVFNVESLKVPRGLKSPPRVARWRDWRHELLAAVSRVGARAMPRPGDTRGACRCAGQRTARPAAAA